MSVLAVFSLFGSSYCLLVSLCLAAIQLRHDVENSVRIRDVERQARFDPTGEHSLPNSNATIVALSIAYSNFENNRKTRHTFR
jgi:hypothetical protein